MAALLPKITIVTPNYNNGIFLEKTILSILNQEYPNLEYIIIDGGSTDNSIDIIRKYESQIAYWVSEPDKGIYDALNKGFLKSTGEIMGWLNSDDLYFPQCLYALSAMFSGFPDVEWLSGRNTWFNKDGQIVNTEEKLKHWNRFEYLQGSFKWIQQESTFWRRSLWNRAGAILSTEYKVAGDLELWVRFFRYAELFRTEAPFAGFRVTGEGQLSFTYAGLYNLEAKEILKNEFELLSPKEKATISQLRIFLKLMNKLKRIKLINWQSITFFIMAKKFNYNFRIIKFDNVAGAFRMDNGNNH